MMKKLLCTLLFAFLAFGISQAQADINVQGNGNDIASGDVTPSTTDGTDFGQVNVSTSSAEQLFVIQNTGADPLSIFLATTTNTAVFTVTTTPAASVPAGGSTTMGITFNAPATAGVTNATVFIINNDPDTGESTYQFALTGEAVLSPNPEINVTGNGVSIIGNGTNTPNTTDGTDFGSISSGNSSSEQLFVIENQGGAALSILSSFTTNPDFAITTTPASSVPAGGSTNIGITYTAGAAGVSNGTLIISNGDSDENPYQINLTALSVAPPPDISVTGNGIFIIGDGTNTTNTSDGTDFGQIDTSTSSSEQLFVIENTGTSALTISPAPFTTDPLFAITTNPGTTVNPGATTTIGITFNAPATPGTTNAQLFINSDDPDESPYQINLTAEAVTPSDPEINVTGNTISIVGDGTNVPNTADGTDFGQVTTNASSAEQIFVIENTGTAALTVNPSVTTNPAFQVTTAAVSPVPAGGSTTIGITFNAPATAGVVNGTLFITNSDSDENPYQINLTGESIDVPGPEMDVFGNGVEIASGDTTPSTADDTDFGQQNVTSGSVSNTFTIQNNGTVDLNLTDPSPFVSITGTHASDFTLTVLPSSPIAPAGSTTFAISFDPSATGIRTASVSIANDDTDENPYTFDIQGEGIDANAGSPLLITQYYEGVGDNNFIEVKNVSTSTVTAGSFFLALYTDLNTTIGAIDVNAPNENISIPAMAPGEVILFVSPSPRMPDLPSSANLGVTPTETAVCNFDGNDVILISTTNDAGCYAARTDIVGVVGSATPPFWGQDISFIKGCGTNESPATTFDYTAGTNTVNDYIELTLEEVNTASTSTNLALGTQTVGSTIYTSSWSNGIPDKTKDAIVTGTYNAADGSFEACNLTISGNLNMNGGTTNFVKVNEDLNISGTFTIGDTESLVTVAELATITGSITKLENSTPLNNFRDFTYWSSPVAGESISSVFTGVDPNRIFTWRTPSPGDPGAWIVASGAMEVGRGYISEAPSGSTQHNVSFTGTPNNGIVSVNLGFDNLFAGGYGFNIIGNPYPSAIDIDAFISLGDNNEIDEDLSNSVGDGTIWLWTHNTQISGGTTGDFVVDDYATYNLTGGVGSGNPAASGGATPTSNIGSGQGFYVRAETAGTVFFTNSMRLDDQNDQFFRPSDSKKSASNEEKDRMWLNIESKEGGAFNQILIGFFDQATDGMDRGYDGLKFNGGNYISFYSMNGEDKLAIQGFGSFDSDRQITLGLDSFIEQTFTISIQNLEGVLKNEEIYLVDNELGVVHDLNAGGYEFEITATGNYTDRFTLQFNKSVLSVDDELLDNNFLVINDNGTLRLRSNSLLQEVQVFDLLGRKLIDVQPNQKEYPLETSSIAQGTVLIIKATLENGAEISKKAIRY